jgi:Cys-tRNA(Pro)/Cys-tRNA(Cys) deacylase
VAQVLGLPAHQVYKTLVVLRTQGRPLLVMIAGDRELDLKRVAAAVGDKKVRMATQREAEALTGLQVGGISALALLGRPFDIFLDRAALALEQIVVSAGKRGMNVQLAVDDLLRITRARIIEATTS